MMKRIFVLVVLSLIMLGLKAQSITTSYSYTWKYDTIYTGQIGQKDFSYTGSVQTFNAAAGTYTLEVWGAQGGGARNSTNDGQGGYSTGKLNLSSQTTLYIYVGGSGDYGGLTNAFNGGGTGYASSQSDPRGGGGGGTDVRIASTSIYARVIVAGGGGGSLTLGSFTAYYGGVGGGTSGVTIGNPESRAGGPGTQTSGGADGYSYSGPGTFGTGGNRSSGTISGGGGGWYGGGSGNPGGGGSGYVYTSSTASYYPAGCLLNSSYYLTSAATYAGNTSFPSTTGSTETGHNGHGYARISYNTKVIDHIDSSISYTYVTTTITDAVCKNGIYNKYGFSVDGSTLSSGVHTYTHFTQTNGKDSTTILNLTIKPGATDFIEVEAPNSYTWAINGETYTQSGIYEYSTVTADGCDSTVILALTIYDPTIGIKENSDIQNISVTPNPAHNYFDIKYSNENPLYLTIYNIYGQICLSQKLIEKETRISVNSLQSGTYFLHLNNGKNYQKNIKIMINK
ncbi:MAG: T9SS type A sorting domain-containing protein [Bacteroidales bacterium]|nr:T9SS type A sorting domain-containing protein [Bacteroidales bacterium]